MLGDIARGLRGIKAFTGLDSPYEAPIKADCEINTDDVELADAVDHILAALFKK